MNCYCGHPRESHAWLIKDGYGRNMSYGCLHDDCKGYVQNLNETASKEEKVAPLEPPIEMLKMEYENMMKKNTLASQKESEGCCEKCYINPEHMFPLVVYKCEDCPCHSK